MKPKKNHWLLETIVALAAGVSLLLFFFPRQPDKLYCIEGHEKNNNCIEKKEIFPTLGILFGQYYRCLQLNFNSTTFLLDFAIPLSYSHSNHLRIWISARDRQRILDNPDIEVRVHAIDILNPDTNRWTRFVPQHPHGHGAFLALGIILSVFLLVLLVKKAFFHPATKQFP